MGNKVNPIIFRIGILNSWSSKWFSQKDYQKFLQQDIQIKEFLAVKLKDASVANIEIERSPSSVTVIIHSAKPGIIIGRGGQGIEDLKKTIKSKYVKGKTNLTVTIQEVSDPNISAALIGQSIVADLEKRMPYRRVLKQALGRLERTDAKGVKLTVAGRLNGAEIARTETLHAGSMPLHTLRADIDYALHVAHTTYGTIGVKVWIYKGQKFNTEADKNKQKQADKKPVNFNKKKS